MLEEDCNVPYIENSLLDKLCSGMSYSAIGSRLDINVSLAWKIPWMEEPGGLLPMGSLRVGQD